ncbi:MAG: efflux RND transporter periplasmic adaptor subunit [Burkholderiales bacterium]|nr:efflux RND transporter periplasmic adaptor subunit [Burkholderiales bacterium]
MAESLSSLAIDRTTIAARRRRGGRKWIIVGVIVAAVVLIGILRAGAAVSVETTKVTQAWPSSAVSDITATGYVVAQKKASIASKGTGRLEWLGVREGSVVKEGEIIARLESADLKAQVAQAKAGVESAKAQVQKAEADAFEANLAFKRSTELLRQGFISPSAHDSAISRLKQAQAAVVAQQAAVRQAEAVQVQAEVNLDNAYIRAPFAGVVLTKTANVGDVITPFNASADSKGAVVTMADMDTLEVEADVSESSLSKAHMDQPCEIQLDALPDTRMLGKVVSVVPSVDRSKATVTFKIGFIDKDARVLPDMAAKVNFLSRPLNANERTPRLAVNPKAVVDGAAYVVADGMAHRVAVTLGDKLGDMTEVKSGLKLGDAVVLDPKSIKDGTKVKEKKA